MPKQGDARQPQVRALSAMATASPNGSSSGTRYEVKDSDIVASNPAPDSSPSTNGAIGVSTIRG